MSEYEKLYRERKLRVETAVSGGTPDRVPNCLLVDASAAGHWNGQQFYARGKGFGDASG